MESFDLALLQEVGGLGEARWEERWLHFARGKRQADCLPPPPPGVE